MARKELTEDKPERGLGDVIGLVLIGVALLLLVALFSYDRNDVGFNTSTPNQPEHNLIGWVGAHGGFALFFTLGAAAYLVPVVLLAFGLAGFLESLQFLRRRWPWALVLLICCMGLLDLYTDKEQVTRLGRDAGASVGFLERVAHNINAPSGGGLLGKVLNDSLFGHFGRVGATIVFVTFYLVSLVFLTMLDWFRTWWEQRRGETPAIRAEAEAQALLRDKEKEVKRLMDQAAKVAKAAPGKNLPVEPEKKSGLGADLQPVPEQTIRDLSVPLPRPPEPAPAKPARGKAKAETEEKPELPGVEGEVISAQEVAAATVDQVLGRKPAVKPPADPEPVAPAVPKAADEPPWEQDPAAAPAPALAADVAAPAVEPVAEPLPILPLSAPKPKYSPKKPKPITVALTPMIGNYQMPTLEFLQMPDMTVRATETKEELMAKAKLMQQTLAQFGIEVEPGDITKGPTITRYELHPAPGVKMERISALSNNIAAALKAERINILAPVPGKSSVGVEVPNAVKTKVILRDLLESPEWRESKARIPLALGKDVYGHPIVADLAEMPHLLIAGSTGSGKSVCINTIVASLLYKFSPDQLRFVMIDPKVVEMQQYNALPHLVVPVVTDPKKVILALRWVVNEMEKRYQIFARVGVRNVKSFNERQKDKDAEKVRAQKEMELPLTAKKEKVEIGSDGFAVQLDEEIVVPRDEDIVIPEKLSYIVVIIDELADLMLVAPADVEMAIARITQMARAAGIHCIVATQRPSVDVITGVIKSNIPARIAFQVAAAVDSRTILDAKGADKLLGKGDMLYLPPGSAKLIRAQGALITDQEIQSIVDFIAVQGKPTYEPEIHKQLQKPSASFGAEESGCGEDESVIEQCIEVIRSEQKASVSLLQRRLKLGYGRAARIMDELEGRGIVGPSNGAEPRDILIDLDGEGADGGGS